VVIYVMLYRLYSWHRTLVLCLTVSVGVSVTAEQD